MRNVILSGVFRFNRIRRFSSFFLGWLNAITCALRHQLRLVISKERILRNSCSALQVQAFMIAWSSPWNCAYTASHSNDALEKESKVICSLESVAPSRKYHFNIACQQFFNLCSIANHSGVNIKTYWLLLRAYQYGRNRPSPSLYHPYHEQSF